MIEGAVLDGFVWETMLRERDVKNFVISLFGSP